MKIFIWERLENVSDNWHREGGLVIVAETLDEAKALVANNEYIKIDKAPDYVYEISKEATKRFIVFPDSGCC